MFELSAEIYLKKNGKTKTLKHFFMCYKRGIITKEEFDIVNKLVMED